MATRGAHQLVLLRHGESEWNQQNLFTGWWDALLTPLGESQATSAGLLMHEHGVAPDVVHTSLQTRAIHTTELALRAMGRSWIPVRRDWRLNERHYGDLTGRNKAETARALRRRPGEGVASQLRRPAAADRRRQPVQPERRRALRPGAAGRAAPHRVPQGRRGPAAPLLGRPDRTRPARGAHRAGRRARQQPPRAGQAARRHQRRRHRASSTSRPANRSSTSSTTTCGRSTRSRSRSATCADPEEIRAAAEAVARQAEGA